MSNGTDVHGDNHNASLQRVYDNVRAQLDEARKDIHRLQVEADRITTLYSEAYRRAEELRAQLAEAKVENGGLWLSLTQAQAERDAAQRDLIHVAEQWHASEKALDAARAEVARLTAALKEADFKIAEIGDETYSVEHGQYILQPDEFEAIRAVLRQPAPAQGQE